MPVGHPCRICSSAELTRRCAELVAAGLSDAKIAAALGAGVTSRAGVNRHRRTHILAPARKLVELSGKDAAAKAQRQDIERAAQAGDLDPSHYLSLASIVGDLRRTGERLERVAAQSEGNPLAVASLSGQQLRAAEVRGRLGGVGAYAPQKQGSVESPMFSITMIFGDRKERIDMMAADNHAPGQTIDMQSSQPGVTTVIEIPNLRASGEADAVLEKDV